jgi:hypothetical protein
LNPERSSKIVAGPSRNDAQWQAGRQQTERDGVHRTITAGDNHGIAFACVVNDSSRHIGPVSGLHGDQ